MENNHTCKLCYRDFASGKALGGHMKSHMMFLNTSSEYASPPTNGDEVDQQVEVEKDQDSDGSESVYLISSSDDEEEQVDADPKGGKRPASVESEQMTRNYPVSKRSKRVPRSNIDGFFPRSNEHSPLSSITENIPDSDVVMAHCLMMLSRDTWTGPALVVHQVQEKDVEEEEEDEYEEDYFSEDSDFGKVVKGTSSSSTKVRGKYKCDTCNKLFRSYQALGGHRTSHKKPKAESRAVRPQAAAAVGEKVYECPYCDRVFASGQAFGGHKRSHFIGGGLRGNVRPVEPAARNAGLELDLNLPAPAGEDEEEISISAVSDAEFVADN